MSEISAFGEKRNEISLMFAVDIFNEGFHINGVDGVLMFRKTKSPIIYFQQLGRALSFSARKKQIKIFDFVDNISDNDVIYELYKEIIAEAKKLTLEMELQLVNHVVLSEEITEDEIEEFEIKIHPCPWGPAITVYRGTTIGHKAICQFPTIKTNKMEIIFDKDKKVSADIKYIRQY